MLFSWLSLPFVVLLTRILFGSYGYSSRRSWLIAAAVGLNPFTVLFAATLRSDLLFTCLLLAALILLHKAPLGSAWVAAAGITAGLAYLTRTAGVVLLPAGVLALAIRRRPRSAALFAAAMLPFMASWMIWVRFHRLPMQDLAFTYYVDYTAFRSLFRNVTLENFHIVGWVNLDAFLEAIGSLIFTGAPRAGLTKALTQTAAVGVIIGVVRLMSKSEFRAYGVVAALYTAMLLTWHYPPNERFVYPMFPLLVAGLLVEGERLLRLVQRAMSHVERSQRAAARVFIAALVLIAGIILVLQVTFLGYGLPQNMESYRQLTGQDQAAFRWISQNTASDDKFLSHLDPILYLYTGRQGLMLRYPPRLWYEGRQELIGQSYAESPEFASVYGLNYLYMSRAFRAEQTPEQHNALLLALRRRAGLQHVYENGAIAIYRIDSEPANPYQMEQIRRKLNMPSPSAP